MQDPTKNLENRNKQLEENYEQWKDHLLMEGVPEDRAKEVALMIDSQNRMDHRYVEAVAHAFKQCVAFDMVNVMPMLSPASLLFYMKYAFNEDKSEVSLEPYEEAVAAKTTRFSPEYETQEELGDWLSNKIVREIAQDLLNNAGTVGSKGELPENGQDITINIMEMSGVIHRKTLRGGASWIMTGPEIANKLLKSYSREELPETDRITKVANAKFNGVWNLLVDPLFEDGKILMGNKSLHLNAYFYCPYIPLTPTEGGLLIRYGKKLLREGAKAYGRIIYNVKEQEQVE